jgi:hypothetical protein
MREEEKELRMIDVGKHSDRGDEKGGFRYS